MKYQKNQCMLLKIENISKSYGAQTVLKDLSFEVQTGETTAIVGPSGSGKTTLLNIIGTLDKPDSGRVLFKNTDIAGMNETEQSAFRNKNIGFVFQMHYLLPQCSLLENVLIPTLSLNDKAKKLVAEERAKQLIEHVGLIDHMHKLPGQLSGGECQRTAFVRASRLTSATFVFQFSGKSLIPFSMGVPKELVIFIAMPGFSNKFFAFSRSSRSFCSKFITALYQSKPHHVVILSTGSREFFIFFYCFDNLHKFTLFY